MDETIIPVDFQLAGQIRDDTILKNLVCRLPEDVCLTVVMDCCHRSANNNNNNKHAYAGHLNRFTYLRAILGLHDRGILTHATGVTGHYSFN